MRRFPLVPVALALILGIVVAHHAAWLTMTVPLLVLGVALLAAGLLLFLKKPAMGALLLAVVAVGALLDMNGDPVHDMRHWSNAVGREAYMTVRLVETPQAGVKSMRVLGEVEGVDGRTARGRLRLYLRPDSMAASLRYGDRLMLHGYPDCERVTLYLTSDHYVLLSHASPTLRSRAETLRIRLFQRMQRGPLDEEATGVAAALALGWKAEVNPSVRNAYRDAGIAHLLAVSGLHVGLLAGMVGIFFFWCGRQRRGRIVRGVPQLVAVWLFALISGLAPSTVRAALMFSLFIVAAILGRRTSSFNLLAATVLITLTANPMLLYDLGWQLSYSAVAGILVARPFVARYRNLFWETAAMSLAATVATLPVNLVAFHQLHAYFLLANIVIVPLAGLALGLSLLYVALPCALTACPLNTVLGFMDGVATWVSSLTGATVEVPLEGTVATFAVAVASIMTLVGLRLLASRKGDVAV